MSQSYIKATEFGASKIYKQIMDNTKWHMLQYYIAGDL